ncbi:lipopolysaccharide biosynthesis protein [Blattabacterium cuenoti]|uniref:lipopolysaccharide biosynthesis protein n=1 Tax=Blattabacterium cuenoti TaxID=1653831 RepID=UPI00293BF409|nr:oligosaccharide flippase family protein [Blattabacterium cuenoti]
MYKKLAIQTIIYSFGCLFPRIVNYIFIKFFTKYLQLAEFSIYTDMYSISFIAISFLSFGLENTYFRFLSKKHYTSQIVFSTAVIIQFIISLFYLILSIFLLKYLVYWLGYKNHVDYLIMFILIIFFDTICILPMAWLRIKEMALKYTIINMINILIQSFIIIYMFFCYTNNNLNNSYNSYYNLYFLLFNIVNAFTDKTGYIFFSNLIASISNFLLIFTIIIEQVNIKNFNFKLSKKMLNYGIPIMLSSIAFSINENLDKILIKRWGTDIINGAYSACYKIASFMSLYLKSFRLGIEPFFFKKSKDYNVEYLYEKLIYTFIIFGLIFYVVICGNISDIIKFLIDKRYHLAISIIPIVMMGNLLLGIYTNLSIFYKIIDKPIIGTYISIIGVLITCIFNFIFIIFPNYKNSFIIPAWGTLFSYGCMLIIVYCLFFKHFRKTYNIIIHLFCAVFIVYCGFYQNLKYRLILQLLYLILLVFLEKNHFFNTKKHLQ